MNPTVIAVVFLIIGLAAVGGYFYTQNQATMRAQQLAIANDPRNQIGGGVGSIISGVIGVVSH